MIESNKTAPRQKLVALCRRYSTKELDSFFYGAAMDICSTIQGLPDYDVEVPPDRDIFAFYLTLEEVNEREGDTIERELEKKIKEIANMKI